MTDIVERLRATSTAPLIPCGVDSADSCCWYCGEYGCHPADCHYRTGKWVTHKPCSCAKCTRDPEGYCCSCGCHSDSPSPLMLEAVDEIERLRKLVTELLPYAVNDAEQGISIGPPPEGDEFCKDCDQRCADCKWYNASVKFMVRYKAGEFSV